MNRIRSYVPQIFYASAALVILLPLLTPGYVLSVDMVFTPHISIPAYASSSFLFWALLHALNSFVPSWVLEKIILFAILFLSGWGMHRWMRELKPALLKQDWYLGCYLAGLLYVFNPFTYSRFMAGQFAVLLGYALLPFFARSLWIFCKLPSIKGAFMLAVWATLIAVLSIHTVGLALILSVCIVLRFVFLNFHNKGWHNDILKALAVALLVTLVANSYWFIPLLTGHGKTDQIIGRFSATDLAAFATVPRSFGLIGNVFTLQGFWADGHNLYLLPSDIFGWWSAPLILLVVFVFGGLIWTWRHERANATIFTIACISGGILAIGTAGTIFAHFNLLLIRHIPLFSGYREPEKFSALVVFGYSYFLSIGACVFMRFMRRRHFSNDIRQVLMVCIFCIPVLCAPLMPLGFHSQLHSVQYPSDWYSMRQYLQSQGSPKTIFLPWHLYMPYSFTGRVIASPAQSFFGVPVIASNNPEFKGASSYGQTQDQKNVDSFLASPVKRSHLGAELRTTDIKLVLLAREYDYSTYDYLDHDPDLQLIKQTTHLKLYKVQEN